MPKPLCKTRDEFLDTAFAIANNDQVFGPDGDVVAEFFINTLVVPQEIVDAPVRDIEHDPRLLTLAQELVKAAIEHIGPNELATVLSAALGLVLPSIMCAKGQVEETRVALAGIAGFFISSALALEDMSADGTVDRILDIGNWQPPGDAMVQ